MKVHNVIQRSPEWFELRRGLITGSEVGKFVFGTDKKSADARQNLIDTKIGEEADGEDCPPSFQDFWMKRGALLEGAALAAYEAYTGNSVEQVGFISHDFMPLGVSPDALINNRSFGLEMKCPSGKIQWKRLRERICPEEYLPQIWLSLIITGMPEWHFWSWHPRLPSFHIIVRRNEVPAAFETGINSLVADLLRQKSEREAMMAA